MITIPQIDLAKTANQWADLYCRRLSVPQLMLPDVCVPITSWHMRFTLLCRAPSMVALEQDNMAGWIQAPPRLTGRPLDQPYPNSNRTFPAQAPADDG